MFNYIGKKVSDSLERPARIVVICSLFLLGGIVFDGTLWRLYQVRKHFEALELRLVSESKEIQLLQRQLKQLKDPHFIEKQARERLEFLEKNDLLFVFSEE